MNVVQKSAHSSTALLGYNFSSNARIWQRDQYYSCMFIEYSFAHFSWLEKVTELQQIAFSIFQNEITGLSIKFIYFFPVHIVGHYYCGYCWFRSGILVISIFNRVLASGIGSLGFHDNIYLHLGISFRKDPWRTSKTCSS